MSHPDQPPPYGQPPTQQWAPQQWPGQPPAGYGAYPPQPAPKAKRKWPWIVGGIVLFFIVVGSCGNSGTPSSTVTAPAARVPSASVATPAPELVAPGAPAAPEPVAPAEPAGPMSSFQDVETLEVGVDIAPGEYRTDGAPGGFLQSSCYYEIHKAPSGSFSDIVKNGNIGENAKGRVSLKAGQYFSSSGGCSWTKS